jgi:hypothetical protein
MTDGLNKGVCSHTDDGYDMLVSALSITISLISSNLQWCDLHISPLRVRFWDFHWIRYGRLYVSRSTFATVAD